MGNGAGRVAGPDEISNHEKEGGDVEVKRICRLTISISGLLILPLNLITANCPHICGSAGGRRIPHKDTQ
jgi:hypothetical protein